MRRMIQGRMHEIPEDEEGLVDVQILRDQLGVADDRALIAQRPNGENEVLPKKGVIELGPYADFLDAPVMVRGAQ